MGIICGVCHIEIEDERDVLELKAGMDRVKIHQDCQKKNAHKRFEGVQFRLGEVTLCMHCGRPIVCTVIEEDTEFTDQLGENIIVTWSADWTHEGEREGSCKSGDTGAYPFNAR